jgi:hypothetical protein
MHEHAVITHIHTDASSGEASLLDPVVTGALRSVVGPEYMSRWKECFNKPEDLLAAMRPAGPVAVVFITDHVNERQYAVNEEAVGLASKDPRIAVGAEIQTSMRTADGRMLRAPEVLVYGRVEKSSHKGVHFYGVSEEDLDVLFGECPVDETGKIDPILVRDYCILGGYAHALAHPFDGSELGLEQLLELITEFKFVETVNGGFPADSSRRLSMFISWYNKAAEGLIGGQNLRSPLLRRLCAKAARTGPIHPGGGSDAHAANHDRVVILYRTDTENPTAGDFISDMVGRSVRDLIAARTFAIMGAPASKISLLDDVMRISYQNMLDHMDIIRGGARLLDVIAKLQEVTAGELMARRRARKLLLQEFDALIGEEVRLGLAEVRRNRPLLSSEGPIDPSRLPERMP